MKVCGDKLSFLLTKINIDDRSSMNIYEVREGGQSLSRAGVEGII